MNGGQGGGASNTERLGSGAAYSMDRQNKGSLLGLDVDVNIKFPSLFSLTFVDSSNNEYPQLTDLLPPFPYPHIPYPASSDEYDLWPPILFFLPYDFQVLHHVLLILLGDCPQLWKFVALPLQPLELSDQVVESRPW